MRRRSLSFKARLFLVSILILLTRNESCAITRAEALDALFSELGYVEMNNPAPPEDVSRTHPFAGVIGSSARRGLIPRSAFSPDETIDRRGAVELALSMIGWRFETLLSKSLDLSPDAEGSLDYIFRLASEMSPPAPKRLLSDGAAPLSAEDKTSLLAWIRNCKDGVIWKKTVSFKDADLTIYRQGVALPNVSYSSFGGGAVGPGSGGPLYIAALSASPASMAARITFAGTAGKDMAPLSEMVRADGAAGGVNGGFFSKDHPVGATLFKGMHTGRPIKGRPAVGWNNEGRFMAFGDGSARVGIRTPVRFIPFKNFNTAPSENENSLFTPGAIGTLPEIAADAARITVRDGVVAERAESPSDCRAIPADSLLIVARGRSLARMKELQPGSRAAIVTDWATPAFADCAYLIQAGPMLVESGSRVSGHGGYRANFLKRRHPRTIMGTDGKRFVWAVIDGRNPIHSVGATIEETGRVAGLLGLQTAINLDGGGSSQMVWRDIIVNLPSEGRERPLPYAVLFHSKAE